MPNSYRAQIDVTLAGETYPARLTFNALVAIEQELGVGMITLARRFAQGEFGVREICVILFEGLKAAGVLTLARHQVGEMILHDGVSCHAETCAQLLAAALGGV